MPSRWWVCIIFTIIYKTFFNFNFSSGLPWKVSMKQWYYGFKNRVLSFISFSNIVTLGMHYPNAVLCISPSVLCQLKVPVLDIYVNLVEIQYNFVWSTIPLSLLFWYSLAYILTALLMLYECFMFVLASLFLKAFETFSDKRFY